MFFKIDYDQFLFKEIGDWGLGIGDWAHPQSPIPNPHKISSVIITIIIKFNIFFDVIYN